MFRIFALCALALPLAARAANGSVAGKVSSAADAGAVVVYVEKGPAEGAGDPGTARHEVLQHHGQFEPQALWVRAGDNVDFVNDDNIYHNVFSPTQGSSFDLGLYRGGVRKTVQMKTPGEVEVFCNIHPDMHARMLVIPAGSRAVAAGRDGAYKLDGLTSGSYTLVAWSSASEPARAQVEVKPGQEAKADFKLKPRAPEGPHLNKNGEQYGRYK